MQQDATNYVVNWEELVLYVLEKYPQEAGGVVDMDNKFHAVPNISSNTVEEYETEAMDFSNVKCVVHSHCYDPLTPVQHLKKDPRVPSKQDMKSQIETAVEWAIVTTQGEEVSAPYFWGDPKHRPSLKDRVYIDCIQDCLAYVTDWQYQNMGLEMDLFPREWDWYQQGYNHLEQQYKNWGFVDHSKHPAEKGDVILFKMNWEGRTDTVNHLGVIIDDKMTVAHHKGGAPGALPRIQPYSVNEQHVYMRVRHKSHPAFKGKKP